jgi:hypothetical protein
MTTATIGVQQAEGTRFSLERLCKIARSQEKEVGILFDKESAPATLTIATKDTSTITSSITDSDGYTTMNRHGGSIMSSLKLALYAPLPFVLTVMA